MSRCICATHTRFVGFSSWVLSLVYCEKVDYTKPFTKAGQTAVSTEHVAHSFDGIHMQLPFPYNDKHHPPFQINHINIDDGAEAHSYLGFIRLYDGGVVEDRDTTPILHETDDNYHSKLDTFDTQRLHNKSNIDELTANLALVGMDLVHFTRSSCKGSATRCSPSARTLSGVSSNQ